MLMSPTQSGISAHQSLANPMGLPAGRFLPLPPIGASIYKYRSISESDRIPAQGWNEETEKDFGQRNGRAASGAQFRNFAQLAALPILCAKSFSVYSFQTWSRVVIDSKIEPYC